MGIAVRYSQFDEVCPFLGEHCQQVERRLRRWVARCKKRDHRPFALLFQAFKKGMQYDSFFSPCFSLPYRTRPATVPQRLAIFETGNRLNMRSDSSPGEK